MIRFVTLSLACIFAVALLFTTTMLFITSKVTKDEIETEYRDIQLELPEDKNLSLPFALAVIADTKGNWRDRFSHDYGIRSPQIKKLNRLAIPLRLREGGCNPIYRPYWQGYQVVEVLSGDDHFTILQRIRSIKTSGFVHFWFKKTIQNFISKKLPARGPEFYQFYILKQDSGDKIASHYPDDVSIHIMKSDLKSPGNKAKNILATFANNKLPRQKVTLLFENPREYTNTCRYEGLVPSTTLSKEFFHSVKQTLDAAGKFHVFKDISYGADSVSLTVDKNSLAYLIFKSSDLRIKDILF